MAFGLIKALGLVVTIGGAGLGLLGSYVEDKKMDEKIDKKLDEREAKKRNSDDKN